MKYWVVLLLLAVGAAWADDDDIRSLYERPQSIPFPDDNPYSSVKATLGKMLFFDPRLSRAQNMNCASCHNPSFGWGAPLAKPVGAQAQPLRRHAPTLLDMAWSGHALFWDGRAPSLEEQVKGPIQSVLEMNLPLYQAVARLQKIEGYKRWFEHAFPEQGLTEDTIVKAIATYERTVVATQAPFDLWVSGDENAISNAAKRGFDLFNGKARCAACHSGWNFTDNQFHDIGLPDETDLGRYEVTGQNKDKYHFKTPGLRNISQRSPYMHDGSLPDLEAVIAHYSDGIIQRETVSPLISPAHLSKEEKADLVAFLKTLTGPDMVVSLPVLPN